MSATLYRAQSVAWITFLLCCLTCAGVQRAWASELTEAQFVLSDAALPPADAAAWQAQSLPDHWRVSRPDVHGSGWYRMHFTLSDSHTERLAILLPRFSMNAAVFVNGVWIGSGGDFTLPLARNWNRPLFLDIPRDVLRRGDNVLHIRLAIEQGTQAGLFPVQVAPESQLRPRYERLFFLNVTLNQVTTLVIAAVGTLMLSLWMRRRQDTAYGLFSAAALTWAAQSTNLYVRDIPMDTRTWETLINAGMQVFGALVFISLLRFANAGWPALERVSWTMMLLAPVTLYLLPGEHFLSAIAFWHLAILVAGFATVSRLGYVAFAQRNVDARILLGVFGIALLFATHDWLMHSKLLWFRSTVGWVAHDVYLSHYSAPMLFLVIGVIMTGRFAAVTTKLENLNADLAGLVRAKHAELEENHARMRALEQEQLVMQERERIYRDLHDDVGAKLLSLVHRAASSDNAALARSALQDLRDVVSSSTRAPAPAANAIADWRLECEQRLSAANVRLDWQDADLPVDALLSAEAATNLGRILREAVSNILTHAQATCVEVRWIQTDRALVIEISDDGQSRDIGRAPPGRGRHSMALRARRMGARIAWLDRAPSGCVVRVEVALPIDALANGMTPNRTS